jgi:hypothetical protein
LIIQSTCKKYFPIIGWLYSPITRGSYVISRFDAYYTLEDSSTPVTRLSLPAYIQSLDSNNMPNGAIALNCAVAAGIIAEFLQDEDLVYTVFGRIGSGFYTAPFCQHKK